MFHSPVLDVAVGLFLVYGLLSLVCTVVSEWIVAATQLRARCLQHAIRELLDDGCTGLGAAFYGHPAIQSLATAGRGQPAYLPPRLVAAVLEDLVVGTPSAPPVWPLALCRLPPSRLRRVLAFRLAGAPPEAAPELLAGWFAESMEYLSAWYRGRLQGITCAVALALCIGANVDTLRLVEVLWGPSAAHWLPAGAEFPRQAAGWLLSALAISRGAPFWFDLLNRAAKARQRLA